MGKRLTLEGCGKRTGGAGKATAVLATALTGLLLAAPALAGSNAAPTVAVGYNANCYENRQLSKTVLELGDSDSNLGDLTVSATSDNQALVPDENIKFSKINSIYRNMKLAYVPGQSGTANVTVTVSDGISTGTLPVTVRVGTSGVDALNGDAGVDLIFAKDGNDVITNGNARNIVCAGGGADTVIGGAQRDYVMGSQGGDTLNGNDDVDLLRGQQGKDQLFGNAGFDNLNGNKGDDTITGGTESDYFNGGPATDTATDYNEGEGDGKRSIENS